jgi:hypothetical protein
MVTDRRTALRAALGLDPQELELRLLNRWGAASATSWRGWRPRNFVATKIQATREAAAAAVMTLCKWARSTGLVT